MGFAEVAEEASPAPGFPVASPTCQPPPIRQQASSASEVLGDTYESASAEDTHTAEPPGPSSARQAVETPFEGIQREAPSWVTLPVKHSTQGIVCTLGATTIFIMVLFSMSHFQGIAATIRGQKGPEMTKQLTKLDHLRTASKWVGFSGAVFGLFWSAVSFLSKTKIFWKIVACGANGVLLVWILFP
jgi:hypothetical protein